MKTMANKLQKIQDALNRAFARKFSEVDKRGDTADDRLDKLEKINENNDRR